MSSESCNWKKYPKSNLLFPTNPSGGKKEKEKKADLEGLIPVDTKSKNRLSCLRGSESYPAFSC
jgi:hypothetical protein